MNIEHYFDTGFQSDIAKLQFSEVPQVLKDILNDQELVLFGGKNWSHVEADLGPMDSEVRPLFVLCLFAVVATDQCMQSYFKPHYARWRSETAYPKFAWTRFGLYNENPLKLLSVPEQAGLLDTARTSGLMREFVLFYRNLVADYFDMHATGLSADMFFTKLLQDDIMALDEGVLVAAFKQVAFDLLPKPASSLSPTDGYFLAV
ncbi:hypothetical protein B9Z47_05805 [Limnohabitans sp. 2KL-1]|jgi:hypothetical protein|uniref:hypothetical protein n=1 Tax=Limnohabitans sp. 2KL-1 TaxID=1100699 RepID=UPI000D3D337D|nr:hypothetical protein [Limnohabitans sp. 2KL-1]PUE49027.1 hypothetical protein B9Z47_05805 [Limnohabitans sp. 2KL-1]